MEAWHEKGITTLIAARENMENAQTKQESQPKASQSKPSHFMNYNQRRYSAQELSGMGLNLLEEDEL